MGSYLCATDKIVCGHSSYLELYLNNPQSNIDKMRNLLLILLGLVLVTSSAVGQGAGTCTAQPDSMGWRCLVDEDHCVDGYETQPYGFAPECDCEGESTTTM